MHLRYMALYEWRTSRHCQSFVSIVKVSLVKISHYLCVAYHFGLLVL